MRRNRFQLVAVGVMLCLAAILALDLFAAPAAIEDHSTAIAASHARVRPRAIASPHVVPAPGCTRVDPAPQDDRLTLARSERLAQVTILRI